MPNLRIVPHNWIDEMVLDGSAVAGMPVSNLQDSQRGHVWRSEALSTTRYLNGELVAGVRKANAFHLFRTNLKGCTYQLQLLDAADVVQWDSGAVTFAPAITGPHDYGFNVNATDPHVALAPLKFYFPTTTFKKFIFGVTGPLDSGDNYAQACRLFLGKYFETTINASYGAARGMESSSDQIRSPGGSFFSNRGEEWGTFNLDLNHLSEAEYAVWLDIMQSNGLHRDFVLSLFDGSGARRDRDFTLNAKFVALDPVVWQIAWRTKRLQVKEC